ncbi:MAG: radical SAM family heme chaperone HemW [Oscillospiraceae bacterium]|jgi:oxygen-independent coproporphyrinogen-3 oxidase|nr:radical SAM family heme chaperone HemW [Oscillospiraceae bacterium]
MNSSVPPLPTARGGVRRKTRHVSARDSSGNAPAAGAKDVIRPGAFPQTLPQNDAVCGIYVHVPFCDGKCPYCDFYSIRGSEERMEQYTERIVKEIKYEAEQSGRTADTLYFGGGTPSLLGAGRLIRIVEAARRGFGLEHAEITVEANPAEDLSDFFREIRAAGVNRLSLGLQSANEKELRLLGRRHTAQQAARCIGQAQNAGFDNLSLDLMLAVQGQTEESLRRSIAFCARAGARHVSAYLLQVEPGTAYFKQKETLDIPDEDEAAALYLLACGELERNGFHQYEISNFAQGGYEGRHNLKYWHDEEYLGFGPAAHSFLNGRRFSKKRSLKAFLQGEMPQEQGKGGDFEEFAMLALRLTEGLTDARCRERFGCPVPQKIKAAAKRYESAGLTVCTQDGFHFTPRGFLVSNQLTAEVLF